MNFDMFNEIDYFTNVSNGNNQEMNYNNNNLSQNNLLFNPYEGYVKGNLFKNLYNTYKNLKPINIKINSERDEMLLNIGELSFARHELNLLLDNYPNNKEILDLFNKYNILEKKQVENYENKFGPLCITSNNMKNIPFKWENDLWPWEV